MPDRLETSSATKPERRDRRQQLVRIVSVIVTVVLLAVLVGEVEWVEFDQLLGRVAPVSWLGALLAYLALNLFRALRFRVLLDKDDTPWRLLAPITLYHNFLVRALPFKLGELSYIALLRSRLNYSMEAGVSSLFGARILELLIIILVFATGIFSSAEAFALERERLMLIIVATFLVCVIGLYFGGSLLRASAGLLLPGIRRLLRSRSGLPEALETGWLQLADELDRVRQPRLFLSALFISCFTYSSSFLTNYVLLRALGIQVEFPGHDSYHQHWHVCLGLSAQCQRIRRRRSRLALRPGSICRLERIRRHRDRLPVARFPAVCRGALRLGRLPAYPPQSAHFPVAGAQ